MRQIESAPMSSTVSDTNLDIREQVVRIDRAIAETQKLLAEADKFRRERFLAPILAAGVLGGAIASIVPAILRSWGVH